MFIRSLARRLAWAALALPLAASAQQAFTTNLLNMRAGPAQDFPIVATLPQGAEVMIQGCTSDYAWCDVQTPNALRGWVYAQYLSHPFQGSQAPVNSMGATIGIPILTFALGAYWANHYRDRSWYHNQSQWDRPYYPQRPPHRPPCPTIVLDSGFPFSRNLEPWPGRLGRPLRIPLVFRKVRVRARRPTNAPRPLTGPRRNGATNRDHGGKKNPSGFFSDFPENMRTFPEPGPPVVVAWCAVRTRGQCDRSHAPAWVRSPGRPATIGRWVSRAWPRPHSPCGSRRAVPAMVG